MDNKGGNMSDEGYIQMKMRELKEEIEELESKMITHEKDMESLYLKIKEKLDKYYGLMKPIIESKDSIISFKDEIKEDIEKIILEEFEELKNNNIKTFAKERKLAEKSIGDECKKLDNSISEYTESKWSDMRDTFSDWLEMKNISDSALLIELEEKLNIKFSERVHVNYNSTMKKLKKIGLIDKFSG